MKQTISIQQCEWTKCLVKFRQPIYFDTETYWCVCLQQWDCFKIYYYTDTETWLKVLLGWTFHPQSCAPSWMLFTIPCVISTHWIQNVWCNLDCVSLSFVCMTALDNLNKYKIYINLHFNLLWDRRGSSDVSPLSGISGLSFDSTFLSVLLLFCPFCSIYLLLFLLLAHSPKIYWTFF